jgi:hypothetical protein
VNLVGNGYFVMAMEDELNLHDLMVVSSFLAQVFPL